MKDKVVERTVDARNCVTIFGGGIAGLTAAHELVERGFRVQLWEKETDQRAPARGAEIGGMARTQWASVPWPEASEVSNIRDAGSWEERQTQSIRYIPQRFIFDKKGVPLRVLGESSAYDVTTQRFGSLKVALELFNKVKSWNDVREMYCEVFDRNVRLKQKGLTRDERRDLGEKIVTMLRGLFNQRLTISGPEDHPYYSERVVYRIDFAGVDRSVFVTVIDLDDFSDTLPPEAELVLGFRVRSRWLPGEHGFRFFPSFYYHLFDTMKRTPILEPVPKLAIGASQERAVTVNANDEKYTESGRTVYDSLHPTTRQAVGFPGSKFPVEFRRSLPTSFEELYQWSRLLFEGTPEATGKDFGLGFSVRDIALFQLKVFQFLSTCRERRREYEKISWIDFLGGKERFSPAFQKALDRWPQALVAMDATDGDARTQGAVFVQLSIDNLRPGGYRDGTLNGPTSEAWLKHWRRYLEAQGVEFIHGKLKGFRRIISPQKERVVWPVVECYEPRYTETPDRPELLPGYFVLALPAREARRVARSYVEAVGYQHAEKFNLDLLKLSEQRGFGEVFPGNEVADDAEVEAEEAEIDGEDVEVDAVPPDLRAPKPKGQLRHMIGIQYFFDEDISWLDGHAYFAGSKWGLSSISQVRFWQDRHDWEHGYRGILSVVIGVLDEPGLLHDVTAWRASPATIAKEVWAQIKATVEDGRVLPEPRYWHFDQGVVPKMDGEGEPYYANETPYQINLVGEWEARPGDLHAKHGGHYYRVGDGIVCAGTHMKTFTRLTTMEAANESARHAVNAILTAANAPTRQSPCEIWPMEERELDDLAFLKEVDAVLYKRGEDHFLEILDLDRWIADALRGGMTDPLNPLAMLARLRSYAEEFREPFTTRSAD